jgi:hypothetical protein
VRQANKGVYEQMQMNRGVIINSPLEETPLRAPVAGWADPESLWRLCRSEMVEERAGVVDRVGLGIYVR